jgi:hypothetical protein
MLLAFDILELYPQSPREQGLSGLPHNTSMVTIKIHHPNSVGLEIGENSRRFDPTSKGKSGLMAHGLSSSFSVVLAQQGVASKGY